MKGKGIEQRYTLKVLPAEIYIPQPEFHHPAELAMLTRLRDEGPALVDAYLAKETKNGVTFIARDAAKRIFPEYKANPTENNRYSDRAASALADAARRLILSRPPAMPRNEVILFTGAPASGKSAAGRPLDIATVEIVHETIFTSTDKARTFLEEAFDAGRLPAISLVYTNDPRINARRMVARAIQIGRTVPLSFIAKTYVEVPRIVFDLSQEFGDRLRISVTDNSGTPAEALRHNDIYLALKETGRYTVDSCLREMDDELNEIQNRNPIPPQVLHEARLC
jgi:hypothetical protein